MKKLIALVLILTLALALVACKNDKTDKGTDNGGGNNDVGNTLGGGGNSGGNVACVDYHTDGNSDWVCDACGSDLSKSGYVDENGTIQLPPIDVN